MATLSLPTVVVVVDKSVAMSDVDTEVICNRPLVSAETVVASCVEVELSDVVVMSSVTRWVVVVVALVSLPTGLAEVLSVATLSLPTAVAVVDKSAALSDVGPDVVSKTPLVSAETVVASRVEVELSDVVVMSSVTRWLVVVVALLSLATGLAEVLSVAKLSLETVVAVVDISVTLSDVGTGVVSKTPLISDETVVVSCVGVELSDVVPMSSVTRWVAVVVALSSRAAVVVVVDKSVGLSDVGTDVVSNTPLVSAEPAVLEAEVDDSGAFTVVVVDTSGASVNDSTGVSQFPKLRSNDSLSGAPSMLIVTLSM